MFIFHTNSWNARIFGSCLFLKRYTHEIQELEHDHSRIQSMSQAIPSSFKWAIQTNTWDLIKWNTVQMLFARDFHNEVNIQLHIQLYSNLFPHNSHDYNGQNHKAIPFTRFKHRSWNKWWFQKKHMFLCQESLPDLRFLPWNWQKFLVFCLFVWHFHRLQIQNWRCKKIEPFVGCQASKAKEKGNERLEGNAKAAATRPWKPKISRVEIHCKIPCKLATFMDSKKTDLTKNTWILDGFLQITPIGKIWQFWCPFMGLETQSRIGGHGRSF